MSLEGLLEKIERMYASVGATTEPDLSKFPPIYVATPGGLAVRQDFNQGQSRAQLKNKAFQVVRSIADLKDHLRAVAKRRGRDPKVVEAAIDASLPLQLMVDLANCDKHGQHARPAEQRSGKSPRLINVRGALTIRGTAGDVAPGAFGLRMTPRGMQPFGKGKSAVVITGDIVDSEGRLVLELQFAQAAAVAAWEALLSDFDVQRFENTRDPSD